MRAGKGLRCKSFGKGTIERRDFLKAAAGVISLGAGAVARVAQAQRRSGLWVEEVLKYLEALRRGDGGYGWTEQERSHLTPTFAAIGCYHLMGREPPEKRSLVEFVRTHHPFRIKKLERDLKVFEYQQIQSLLWLGEDAGSFRKQVQSWKRASVYPKQYERDGYPVLRFEAMAFVCRRLLGLGMEDISPGLIDYLDARRRENGSFNNTPASEGGDGHVMNTLWGLQALDSMGRAGEKRAETVDWIRDCQMEGGGFTYQPRPAFAGVADVTYTWAGLRSLELYDEQPVRGQRCIDYLRSLWNEDGGFGARKGWASNPVATHRALDAMRALGGLDELSRPSGRNAGHRKRRGLPSNLRVLTIQIEAPGKGSPTEAVELAGALRIDLWGAKNAPAGWIATAQAIADERKVPVTFVVSNEEYGTFVKVAGLGIYSHTSDIIAPANADFGSSLSGEEAVGWEEFRRRRLAPLERCGGRLIWQFGENEELTRLYLDDSLERGGYAAISTFHFGNPDFANSEPFLKEYGGRIPFVGLQDAHGSESWWWGDQLTGFRTLFLATEASWEGWLKALKNNWVVAVRHDAVSSSETWMHGGGAEVLEFVRRREEEWRWWDNPGIGRPAVSVVAVRREDRWEAGRPERGVTLRVRCQRHNTGRGQPKGPVAELVELVVDGRKVAPRLDAPKAQWGAYKDYCHYYHIANPSGGKHTATATARIIETGDESSRTIEFGV
ncbi:MAG: prenyltransferase [Phycisphaerae bacterium]|nr:prenyltransferase [Phycisphaerae bacterium]